MKTQLKNVPPGSIVRFGSDTVECAVTDDRVRSTRLIRVVIVKTQEGFWRGEEDAVWTDSVNTQNIEIMNTQPFPKPLSDFIDDAFEQIKIFEYKERIRNGLKRRPASLSAIQQVAKESMPNATGVSKVVFEWILAGCPDEN